MYELLAQDKDTLGEACGIFAGDGGMYETQRSIVLEVRGRKDELNYYSNYVRPIFEKILPRKLKLIKRSYSQGYVIGILVCGKEAVRIFHTFLEFPIGNKSNNLRIPRLVFNNHEYWKAYVRGVFDTSGSVYLRKTGERYRNPVVEISSHSLHYSVQDKSHTEWYGAFASLYSRYSAKGDEQPRTKSPRFSRKNSKSLFTSLLHPSSLTRRFSQGLNKSEVCTHIAPVG